MKITERQSTGESNYGLKIGIAECKIIAVNPSLKWLKANISDKMDKEYEYIGEKDGKDYVDIIFWVKEVKGGQKHQYKFRIVDEPKVWPTSGKKVYVNQSGMSATVACEDDLMQWFTKFQDKDKKVIAEKVYRAALQGEPELYEFLRNYIAKGDWFSPGTDILQDTKKLMKGKVSDLQELVDSDMVGTVILPFYVSRVEKDGEVKYYQNIGKSSLPGWMMKKINLSIQQDSWDSDKDTKKFKDNLTGQYGITSKDANAFVLDHLKPFNAEDHIQMGDSPIKHSNDSGDIDYDV
jgi:hypothetical protein